ncbi:hypothetical protein BGZ61DRAFT_479132 [Ilyonectria robusta]|uniref:uncharacterized protein n=1 Tax=Ilyonectria robusta TaxID=1079257 RepID=UPI001E8EADA6|nr:uncharacterized protein BGZ61DRAFT_479132 [Ilyonectria robusta]KAH8686925.1 hypothetical protein BGZ61DRAFT_479132 [Ilyonectria robusta]
MTDPERPLIPLSVMDFDLSNADDEERCRAQLLVSNYLRIAPSMTTDMQRTLKETLVYEKAWKTPTEKIVNYDSPSNHKMYDELFDLLFFPHWFVLAVCWGPNHPDLQEIKGLISRHWGEELPEDGVIYPGEKTSLDFDAFCGEIVLIDEIRDYDFKIAAKSRSDVSGTSTVCEPIIEQAQPSEQTLASMEETIDALQKEVWDLKARVGMMEKGEDEWSVDIIAHLSDHFRVVHHNQQEIMREIAELKGELEDGALAQRCSIHSTR